PSDCVGVPSEAAGEPALGVWPRAIWGSGSLFPDPAASRALPFSLLPLPVSIRVTTTPPANATATSNAIAGSRARRQTEALRFDKGLAGAAPAAPVTGRPVTGRAAGSARDEAGTPSRMLVFGGLRAGTCTGCRQ